MVYVNQFGAINNSANFNLFCLFIKMESKNNVQIAMQVLKTGYLILKTVNTADHYFIIH